MKINNDHKLLIYFTIPSEILEESSSADYINDYLDSPFETSTRQLGGVNVLEDKELRDLLWEFETPAFFNYLKPILKNCETISVDYVDQDGAQFLMSYGLFNIEIFQDEKCIHKILNQEVPDSSIGEWILHEEWE